MVSFENPILPGFYPDPSICRVGEDYYLVNSSFEFFPGVPLWHSRDLLHWEQLGHVLTRPSQDPLEGCRASGGIFAPTIRHHNGRFYMVTTNVSAGGNFFVWADDIRGPWSEPITIKQGGIDPSFFWDDDGTVYFQSTFGDINGQCIGQCVVDLETGEMLTETRPIWHGTGGKCPEGPHMYKINGKYYLMIAEGGTEYGHMETIARSDSPWGPFESCPRNPILSHRDINPRTGIPQGLGHADLVEDQNGQWWIVFHGIRPSQFMLHHMGRETMIAPVDWDENGWPVVNGGKPIENPMTVPTPPNYQEKPVDNKAWKDCFQGPELDCRWAYLRNPVLENYSLGNGLTLRGAAATLDDCASPTFVGVRQGEFCSQVEVTLTLDQLAEGARLGLSVFHVPQHHYDLFVTRREGQLCAVLRRRVVDMVVESAPVALPEGQPIQLRIDSARLGYTFYAGAAGQPLAQVGTGCTQLLSTEVTICTFTGCFYGMFAEGASQGTFQEFTFTPLPEEA